MGPESPLIPILALLFGSVGGLLLARWQRRGDALALLTAGMTGAIMTQAACIGWLEYVGGLPTAWLVVLVIVGASIAIAATGAWSKMRPGARPLVVDGTTVPLARVRDLAYFGSFLLATGVAWSMAERSMALTQYMCGLGRTGPWYEPGTLQSYQVLIPPTLLLLFLVAAPRLDGSQEDARRSRRWLLLQALSLVGAATVVFMRWSLANERLGYDVVACYK